MDERLYKVIEFIGKSKGKRSVEFVPSNWIEYDRDIHDLVTKFIPTPYTKESVALLDEHIKLLKSAPDDWPKFPVAIIGDAKSFDDAVAKVKLVETERYAFSTDCDDHAQIKSLAVKKSYQFKNTSNSDEDLSELLKVPTLDNSIVPPSDSSDSSQHEQLPESTSVKRIPMKKVSRNRIGFKSLKSEPKITNVEVTEVRTVPLTHNKQQDDDNNQSTGKLIPPRVVDMLSPVLGEGLSVKSLSIQLNHSVQENNEKYEPLVTASRSHSNKLSQIELTLIEMKNTLEKMSNAQEQGQRLTQQSFTVAESFAAKHNIVLPITTLADFEEFDQKLVQSNCEQLKRDIWPLIEAKSNLSRSLSNILKKYLSRIVMIEFTAVKRSPGKRVFNTTCFCGIVKDSLMEEYNKHTTRSPINDKKFYDALGAVINNAKDWEGHRLLRKKKPVNSNSVDDSNVVEDNTVAIHNETKEAR